MCDDCDDFIRNRSTVEKILCPIIGVILFISFFLIGFSVTTIEPLYYALKYDKNARQLSSEDLYDSGRIWTGLGFEFIDFPRYIQILIFSDIIQQEKSNKTGAQFEEEATIFNTIRCRSKEGLQIDVDVFVGYRLTTSEDTSVKLSQLLDIHQKFGMDWTNFLRLTVLSDVRTVFSTYDAQQIPSNRQTLSNLIFTKMQTTFNEFFFQLEMVNLINIQFPKSLDVAYTNTQIAREQESTMQFKLQTAQIYADNKILLAQLQKTITVDKATAQGEANYIKLKGIADMTEEDLGYQATALATVSTTLGFTACSTPSTTCAEKLLNYYWINVFLYSQSPKTVLYSNTALN